MKCSILIANYNNGKFFKDCYNSLINQTYGNWEAIILDDASTDNSLEVIKEMIGNDVRFRIFENDENSGVGVTKSKLIDLATGEICGFLDPDDALLPNAISTTMAVFIKDKKVVLTYSNFFKCDADLKPISEGTSAKQISNHNPFFFNCPIVINHFVCFRKSVYISTEKMDATKKIAEDQDLYLKMYEKGKVKFINQSLYLYRFHSGGISQNDNKKKSYDFWGEVIFNAMKRRGLKKINGKKIPEQFSTSEEIFNLLEYQNALPYKIKQKLKLIFG